ncbi:TPA: HlyD family secretion protein [Escherichia coli]|nr:HlyD family secretion protein [Escherichia coli]
MIISKKQLIGVVAIGILLAGVVFFIWWVSKGRFIQTTDDAYIGGNITTVASKVSGYISAIEVRDNQSVKKGDIILRLDLESIQATIAMQQSIIQSASETWQAVKHEEQKRLRDTERYEKLAQSAAISQQIIDNARFDYQQVAAKERKAANDFLVEKQRLAVLSAQEENVRASIEEVQAALTQALLDLEYTLVRAPIDGIVANRSAHTGSWVEGGTSLVSLVPVSELWVDANYKENQIAGMKPGMKAEIRADILKGEVFHGHIESLSPATGASFSLIPIENATGNFTKIVQRVPVRIAFDDAKELKQLLRPGLSVTVSVDER